MNIFVLDIDPRKSAQYHCDKHIVKMTLESAQIMCTILNEMGYNTPYKTTHKNHPCTVWARQSLSNYMWLRQLGIELHKEYQYRYGKLHKSGILIESLPIPNIKERGLFPFAQAMPDKYKDKNFVVAYRNYYANDKKDILKYTKRNVPEWLTTIECK